MTIVMIGHKGLPARSGGIERHVEDLSTVLVQRGERVISFDRKWYVGDASSPAGVERRWSTGIRSKHLDAITHTLTAIVKARADKPDVIHIHGVGPSLLLPLVRVLHPSARVVSTFHTPDRMSSKWGFIARTMLWLGEWFSCYFAHRTIAVSDTIATYCLNAYQCQTTFIPNGVKDLRTAEVATSTIPTEKFGVQAKRYFLMATRLVPHKNVHIAIEAHRLFTKRNPELAAAYPLVIAGGASWTSDYERVLRDQAASLPNVRLVGEQGGTTLAALQAQATCHLSIASSEGMSIALLEAGMFARPVIVSDIPENVEVFGELAATVPMGDAQVLSDAMECAALLSDTERDESGARLRERILERHNMDRIADLTLDVYRDTIPGAQLVEQMA